MYLVCVCGGVCVCVCVCVYVVGIGKNKHHFYSVLNEREMCVAIRWWITGLNLGQLTSGLSGPINSLSKATISPLIIKQAWCQCPLTDWLTLAAQSHVCPIILNPQISCYSRMCQASHPQLNAQFINYRKWCRKVKQLIQSMLFLHENSPLASLLAILCSGHLWWFLISTFL